MRIIFAWMLFGLFFLAEQALAQDISRYVSIKPQPDWVNTVSYPNYEKADVVDRDRYFEIVDWQSKIDPNSHSFFSRYAEVLVTSNGVEENSNVEISFDPSYETISLHYIRVRRDGVFIDKTNLDDFSIYRKETDRDKLLYNGTMEVSYIVPDVRVGDMLEYAYTNHGKNPALKTHYAAGFRQAYNDIALKLTKRILINESLPVYTKSIAGAKEPEKIRVGKYDEYSWNLTNEEPVRVDDNVPDWYYRYPTYQFSSFKDWSEVGRFFAPVYQNSQPLPPQLLTVQQNILKAHKEPKARVRAALGFVQENIRYLGIEIGEGGYIPRPIDKVMSRRFGDCKDMTVLLVALLKSMDFEAAPLLVNSSQRGGIANALPKYSVFDHVVVRVVLGDDVYILDPTRGEQLGDLDHLQQGNFEKGLVISSNSPGMISAVVPEPDFYKDFQESFDLVVAAPDVLLTSTAIYSMGSADSIKSWHESSGIEAIKESYLEYYQDRYPTVKPVGEMTVSFDDEKGQAKISVDYEIPDPWTLDSDRDINELSIYASEVATDIPDFDGEARADSYAIPHPIKTRQVLELNVNDSWHFEDSLMEEDYSAFYFKKQAKFVENVYTESYEYHSKFDHITASEFSDTMGKLDDIDDQLGIALENPVNSAVIGGYSEDQLTLFFVGIFILMAIASLIGAALVPLETQEELAEQEFHPVALPKFIILSIVSLGIYQYYWIFKNWRWVQKHQEQTLTPLLRSFFMNITNFSLFPRMTQTETEGYNWFKTYSVPLAILIVMTSIISNLLEDYFFVLFVPVLLLILPAMQVLKLNEGRDDVIARNSNFGVPTILFLVVWLPLFAITLYGNLFG